MGHDMPTHLPPLRAPAAVEPHFIASRPTTLLFSAESGRGGDVYDAETGQAVFHLRGYDEGKEAIKEVVDTKGRCIFALRKTMHHFGGPDDHRLVAANGTMFMGCRWDGHVTHFHFEAQFPNNAASGGQMGSMQAELSRSFFKSAEFVLDGQTCMVYGRDTLPGSARDFFKYTRPITVAVAPGMDLTAALAAALYCEERVVERKKRNGHVAVVGAAGASGG